MTEYRHVEWDIVLVRQRRAQRSARNKTMRPRKQIAVLGSFLTNAQSIEYAMAEDLGYLLAKNGCNVICGGHGGIANPLVSGVARGGGVVRGVAMSAAKFPKRTAKLNPHITEVVHVNSISERLEILADSDGYVFFTGGIGTLAEFAFIWHSLQVAADFTRPVIFISRGWKQLLAEIKQEQMVKHKYYRIVHLCERVKDAVAVVTNDYSLKYEYPGSILFKEAVFFDLDGTIVESPEEVFVRLCENIGYFFRMPDVIAAFRKTERLRSSPEDEVSYLISILKNFGITAKSAGDVAVYLSQGFKQIPEMHDDVTDILQYFKENGFFTGLISSRHPLQLQEILSAHALSGFFDIVRTLNHSAENPTTRSLEEELAGSGLRKDGIIHIVDDFSEGYHDHRVSGVDSIMLDRNLTHISNDHVFTVRSLVELKYIIKHGAAA